MKKPIHRIPGRAVEILVFKLIEGSRRRTLVAHLTLDSNLRNAIMPHGVGRYRVEWRDARRWITRANGIWVWPDGRLQQVSGRKRPPRKLDAPKKVW